MVGIEEIKNNGYIFSKKPVKCETCDNTPAKVKFGCYIIKFSDIPFEPSDCLWNKQCIKCRTKFCSKCNTLKTVDNFSGIYETFNFKLSSKFDSNNKICNDCLHIKDEEEKKECHDCIQQIPVPIKEKKECSHCKINFDIDCFKRIGKGKYKGTYYKKCCYCIIEKKNKCIYCKIHLGSCISYTNGRLDKRCDKCKKIYDLPYNSESDFDFDYIDGFDCLPYST